MKLRALILGLATALGLAACTTTPTVSQVATDARLVASGLAAVVPTVAALAGIPPATVTQINGDLATAQAAAQALASVTAGQAPVNVVAALVDAVNDIVALATTPPLASLIPPQIETVFAAAHALLPSIEAAAGLSGAAPGTMPPDAARLILLNAAR